MRILPSLEKRSDICCESKRDRADLRYYQVVMMVDIFQYTNMYTLKPSISRLAADETIINECGTYVTRHGHTPPSWPELLGLYSNLQPGVTVHEWAEKLDILDLGIDPRRFVSFGVIKGFLRRVHRWPVMLEYASPLIEQPEKRKVEFKTRVESGGTLSTQTASARPGDSTTTLRSVGSNASLGVSPGSMPRPSFVSKSPSRRMALTSMNSFPRSLGSGGDSRKSRAMRVLEEQNQVEEELLRYLDGNHHSDEIQVKFGMGWKQLERLLGVDEMKDGKSRKGFTVVYR